MSGYSDPPETHQPPLSIYSLTEQQRGAATKLVRARAHDPADAALLLATLGLADDPAGSVRSPARGSRS